MYFQSKHTPQDFVKRVMEDYGEVLKRLSKNNPRNGVILTPDAVR